MGSELDQLNDATQAETTSLAFFTAFASTLIATVIAWATAPDAEPVRVAVFVSLGVTLLVGTAWFGIAWNRARKKRPALIERIKSRGLQGVPTQARL